MTTDPTATDQTPPPPPPAASEVAAELVERLPIAGPWIAASLQPSVRFKATAVEAGGLAVGATRYGGDPDLPEGAAWPAWTNPAGELRNLRFFAQIDLAAVAAAAPAPLDLPTSGLLSFFADFGDWDDEGITGLYSWEQAGATVLFTATGTALERRRSPVSTLPSGHLEPVGTWTWWSEDVELSDDEFDALDELEVERYDGGRHQIGGHEAFIQHPVAEEVVQALAGCYEGSGSFDLAAWERVEPQVGEWRLLLQLDSDDELDAMWGDVGTIYWMARREDLAAGRWDAGMFNFQCS